jgi:hypothetical protein
LAPWSVLRYMSRQESLLKAVNDHLASCLGDGTPVDDRLVQLKTDFADDYERVLARVETVEAFRAILLEVGAGNVFFFPIFFICLLSSARGRLRPASIAPTKVFSAA